MDEKKKNLFSTVVVSTIAAVFIAVAVLVLFVPRVEVKDICYFICGFVVVLGIYMIVRYFMTGWYERLNEYGFSEGVLFVLLGICGLVSAERIAASFLTALGLLLLLSGVIKLQYALDLKCMGDKAWTGFFVVTLILLGCSVSVILKPFEDMGFYQNYTAYILLVDGIVEIANIFYLNFRTKAYQQRVGKTASGEHLEVYEPKKQEKDPEVEIHIRPHSPAESQDSQRKPEASAGSQAADRQQEGIDLLKKPEAAGSQAADRQQESTGMANNPDGNPEL